MYTILRANKCSFPLDRLLCSSGIENIYTISAYFEKKKRKICIK